MKKLFTLLAGTFLAANSFAQLIYKDDFANGTSGPLPGEFTVINNDANTIDPFYTSNNLFSDAWELRNFGDGLAAYSCSYYTASGTASDWMILGPISLPAGSSPKLSFESYADIAGTTFKVYATATLAGTSPVVTDFPAGTLKTTNTASVGVFAPATTVDLTSLAGNNKVYIAIVNTSVSPAANPKDILGIRKFRLVAPISQDVAASKENYGGVYQANDIFAASYNSYTVLSCNTNSATPSFQIKNVGTAPISNYTAYFQFDDTIRFTQPVTLGTPLAVGDSLTHTFASWAYTEPFIAQARMWARVAGDSISDNDTVFNLILNIDTVYDPALNTQKQSFEVADANNQIDFEALTWAKIDGNNDGKTFSVGGGANDAITPPSDGDYDLYFDPKGALQTLNEWVVSPCMQLNAGTVYNLQVDAAALFGAVRTFKVFIGNDNKPASLTTQVGTFIVTPSTDTILSDSRKSITFTVATSGVYHVGLNVAGTQAAYLALDNLTLGVITKPTALFTALTDLPSNADCDKSVGVKVTAANNAANTYSWTYGDGGTATGYSPAAHTYATYGTFTIKLVVSNLAGSDSSTQVVTVAAPAVPVASFTQQNTVGKTYKFTNTSTPAGCVSYSWDFGVTTSSADTSTAKSPTYTFPVAGTYNVCLTVTNVIGDVNTKCVTVQPNGIDDVTFNNNIAIYPNPTTGIVNFEIPTSEKDLTISIYNILGSEVKSIKEVTSGLFDKNYNLSDLSNGTYIVKITNGNKTATKKLTISK